MTSQHILSSYISSLTAVKKENAYLKNQNVEQIMFVYHSFQSAFSLPFFWLTFSSSSSSSSSYLTTSSLTLSFALFLMLFKSQQAKSTFSFCFCSAHIFTSLLTCDGNINSLSKVIIFASLQLNERLTESN